MSRQKNCNVIYLINVLISCLLKVLFIAFIVSLVCEKVDKMLKKSLISSINFVKQISSGIISPWLDRLEPHASEK